MKFIDIKNARYNDKKNSTSVFLLLHGKYYDHEYRLFVAKSFFNSKMGTIVIHDICHTVNAIDISSTEFQVVFTINRRNFPESHLLKQPSNRDAMGFL